MVAAVVGLLPQPMRVVHLGQGSTASIVLATVAGRSSDSLEVQFGEKVALLQ